MTTPLPKTAASLTLGRALACSTSAATTSLPRLSVAPTSPTQSVVGADRDTGAVRRAVRWVVMAGFGQMILFGLLFLAIRAHGETAEPARPAKVFPPPFTVSAFQPQATRDPFGAVARRDQPTGQGGVTSETHLIVQPGDLRLQGILFDPRAPTAVINDQILERGKPSALRIGTREVTVVAEQIHRETVVLRVGDQTVTLRLGEISEPAAPRQGGIPGEK